jgi:hypothetical protein
VLTRGGNHYCLLEFDLNFIYQHLVFDPNVVFDRDINLRCSCTYGNNMYVSKIYSSDRSS